MRGDEEWGTIPGLVRDAARRYGDRRGGRRGPHPHLVRRTRRPGRARRRRVHGRRGGAGRPGRDLGARTRWTGSSPRSGGHGGRGAGPPEHPLQGDGGGPRPARAAGPGCSSSPARSWGPRTWRRCAGRREGSAPDRCRTPHLEQVVVLADDAPEDYRTWKDFLASGEGVPAAGGAGAGGRRSTPPPPPTSSSPRAPRAAPRAR